MHNRDIPKRRAIWWWFLHTNDTTISQRNLGHIHFTIEKRKSLSKQERAKDREATLAINFWNSNKKNQKYHVHVNATAPGIGHPSKGIWGIEFLLQWSDRSIHTLLRVP